MTTTTVLPHCLKGVGGTPIDGATAWGTAEFTERLRAVAAERYHDRHPFNVRMHRGELSQAELRRWIANRFHYQRHIPVKDALILAGLDRPEPRRSWLRRIQDHDGTAEREGGIERWLRLGEAAGLHRDELWDGSRVLPGVRFAVDGGGAVDGEEATHDCGATAGAGARRAGGAQDLSGATDRLGAVDGGGP